MSSPYLVYLIIFIFLDFPEEIIVTITFGYLFGQFYKLLELLLFTLFLIFFELNAEIQRIDRTHLLLSVFKILIYYRKDDKGTKISGEVYQRAK